MRSVRKRIRIPSWQLGPWDHVEVLLALSFVFLLNLLALNTYRVPDLLRRIGLSDVFTLSLNQQLCLHESWAVRGEFPSPRACAQLNGPGTLGSTRVRGIFTPVDAPAFAYEFDRTSAGEGPDRIGLWLSAGPGPWPATFAWHCGSTPAAPGMHALGPDLSTIRLADRPSGCRTRIPYGQTR